MTTLYYHTTPTCAPCKTLLPMARSVAEEAGINFSLVDVTIAAPVVTGISAVPTIVIREPGRDDIVLGPQSVKKRVLREHLGLD